MRKVCGLVVTGVAIAFSVASAFAVQEKGNRFTIISSVVTDAEINRHESLLTIQSNAISSETKGKVILPIHEYSSVSPVSDSVDFPKNRTIASLHQTEVLSAKDRQRLNEIMEDAIANNLHELPFPDMIQAIATQFLGADYQAGLLDIPPQETLLAFLTKFDCVLFVETVLALTRGIAVQDYTPTTFVNHIEDQRYVNGEMNGYCSRLHYFSEWIADNEKRGNVKNLSQELSGIPLDKTLNFMTQNRSSYRQVSNNEANYNCLLEKESSLAESSINYIPKTEIRKTYDLLQPGDIIGLVTNIEGLDTTHTGLVYRTPNGNLGLIHASPMGQVKISSDLHTYVNQVNNTLGIVVARPLDSRSIQRSPDES